MNKNTLLEEYKILSHQDKYDKLIVYLHAAQKSEENIIWLYLLIEEIWIDKIDDNLMIELYDAFSSLVEYNDKSKLEEVRSTVSKLLLIKNQERAEHNKDKQDADNLLESL